MYPLVRILVVDDDLNVCTTLSAALQMAGYAADTAVSIAGAICYLSEGRLYDLVLCDVHLGANELGFDLFDLMNRLLPTPFIFISSDQEAKAEAARRGCLILDKPIELDALMMAIDRLLHPQPHLPVAVAG